MQHTALIYSRQICFSSYLSLTCPQGMKSHPYRLKLRKRKAPILNISSLSSHINKDIQPPKHKEIAYLQIPFSAEVLWMRLHVHQTFSISIPLGKQTEWDNIFFIFFIFSRSRVDWIGSLTMQLEAFPWLSNQSTELSLCSLLITLSPSVYQNWTEQFILNSLLFSPQIFLQDPLLHFLFNIISSETQQERNSSEIKTSAAKFLPSVTLLLTIDSFDSHLKTVLLLSYSFCIYIYVYLKCHEKKNKQSAEQLNEVVYI